MKHFLIFTVFVTSLNIICLRADDKPLAAPRPTKDPEASKKHAQGSGVFVMTINKPSGKVTCVGVRSSTGNVFLDVDVINTLLQWRFKSNVTGHPCTSCTATESEISLPVTFTADSDAAVYPVGRAPSHRGIPGCFSGPLTPGKLNQLFPIY
jgi:hypothetical protein